ncbi:MAG: hypothetical protein JWN11_2451 [Hyphomicrobiales bacterium]|nr:hypothetical protein [Hyphomicrobiales bacterium]
MTMPSATEVIVAPGEDEYHSYVDWAAIIGGIILASAISLIMITFGSAIGLSMTNFRSGQGASPVWIAIAAASWLLWVQVSSFMAGAYLTGRLRRRFDDATEHEVDVRDGAHGLLVWAGGTLLGAIIIVSGLGAAAQTAGQVASTVTNAAANVAGGAAAGAAANPLDPTAYFVDALFRPAAPAPAAAGAAPAATPTPPAAVPAASNPAASAEAKAEAARIFAQAAASGQISDPDKAYLATVVAQNTGLSPADAQARVDAVLKQINDAKQKAADAAEQARKMTVLGAFLTAASLLISAAAAFWAAQMGGNHRDKGTVFHQAFRRY